MTMELGSRWRPPGRVWPLVSTLIYRSQSATPMPAAGLERLLTGAKRRNRRLGVTGMLLYSDNQFFQWLEGPPEGVAEVWDAIRQDPRHGHIELIDHHTRSLRLFADWDMKFICREASLAGLSDHGDSQRELHPGLINLMAQLALDGDAAAIMEGLEELLVMGQDFLALHGALIEPAARLLGDWWCEDRITAVEIAIALSYLQSAVRRIGAGEPDAGRIRQAGGDILIATAPGEIHGLGAALVGDVFRRSGWRVAREFPPDVAALSAELRANRFDALCVCLSDVLDRAGQIGPLASLISAARAASANPALVVMAGGRLFRSQPALAAFIGADAVYSGAAEALARTLAAMGRPQSPPRPRAGRAPTLH
jgi:methanogenic corrinoid protein MtbC1